MIGLAGNTGGSFHPAIGRQVRGDRALVRELAQLGRGHGTMVLHEQKLWRSITFSGARHRMTWCFEGREGVAAGELFVGVLPDYEFSIPGRMVAAAAVTAVDHRLEPPKMVVEVELLVLDEG